MTPMKREAMRAVFREVAAKYELDEADLYVRDRRAHIVDARHEAFKRCRKLGYSLEVIGTLAGWDHTTIMAGIKAHEEKARRG